MALSNFTLPFGGIGLQSWGATASPIQYTAVNNLVYGPQTDNPASHQEYYKNSPYSPPAPQRSSQSQYHDRNTRRNVGNAYLPPPIPSSPPSPQPPARTYGETNYVHQQNQIHSQASHFNGYNTQTRILSSTTNNKYPQQSPTDGRSGSPQPTQNTNDPFPERPPGFTHVQAGQGSRTQVHAVLDYDADEGDYYDQEDEGTPVGES